MVVRVGGFGAGVVVRAAEQVSGKVNKCVGGADRHHAKEAEHVDDDISRELMRGICAIAEDGDQNREDEGEEPEGD